MASPPAPRARSGFKIAIICALALEAESVRAVFDTCWEDEGQSYGKTAGDKNTYTTGAIGRYNVVLVLLPGMGSVAAAQAAASLGASYPQIELVLVVGVCGVVPQNPATGEEIVLGDVIVSTAVTQYDFSKTYPGGFQRKTSVQDSLRKAPKEVQGFVDKLGIRQNRQKLRADLTRLVESTAFQKDEPTSVYPGTDQDHLYEASYLHQHRPPVRCEACYGVPDAICSIYCDELGCEKEKRVARQRLRRLQTQDQDGQPRGGPLVHLGRIGSADTVMKSGLDRDTLVAQDELIAFDMEGAGVWDEHPTIVIKGACDYADSHKHKAWQLYAAMMAAGCLKVVLAEWIVADELVGSENPKSVGFCLASAPLMQPDQFIGRAVEMEDIYHVLQPDLAPSEQRRVVLGGIGGVGKTQLAIAYARRYQRVYTSVIWLNASSQLALYTSIRSAASSLSPASEKLDDKQVLIRFQEWLSDRRNTQWLLIFDNYDDPDYFEISRFYPTAGHGSIIVTTRLPDKVAGSSVRVRPFTAIDDCLDILQARSGRQSIKDDLGARRLAERMAGLPLALVTAGAYLRKNTLSFQQYLDIYEQRWQVDRRRPLQLLEYADRTLYTTWNLSYSRLEADDAEATQMLQLLAYFDHQAVWYELVGAGLSEGSPQWLQACSTQQIDFESVIGRLVEYCFVEVQATTKSYSIHACVHDWTLRVLNRDIDPTLYWYTFDCVARSISHEPWESFGDTRHAKVTPHAVRLAHPRLKTAGQDIVSTRLKGAEDVAELLEQQVLLDAAAIMRERALAGKEKALGPDHPDTLDTVNNLGLLYRAQGKLDKAEQMYLRALAGKEKALGPNHTDTLATVNNLGVLYQDQGKLEDAEQMLERALARRENVPGLEHINIPNDPEESHLDDLSDISEVSSIESMPSMTTDSTSISETDDYGFQASQHLVTLFCEDSTLSPVYDAATAKFDSSRFQRNHDQLLKKFFKDLRLESSKPNEIAMVRVLRHRDRRHEITTQLQNVFRKPAPGQKEAMAILINQRSDRKHLLNRLMGEDAHAAQNLRTGDDAEDKPDEELSDSESESQSSDNDDYVGVNSNTDELNVAHQAVDNLERFIRRSHAFSLFKTNLNYLLKPPTSLAEALASRDLRVIQRFLSRNFESAARGTHEWLHELDAAGYSKREIAELLVEDANDSPWIYFVPQEATRRELQSDYHISGCAHEATTDNRSPSQSISEQISLNSQELGIRRKVEELCGIAGVVPASRNLSAWYGNVTFDKNNTTSRITYAANPTAAHQSRDEHWMTLSTILRNFSTAAAIVQSAGLCCNSFTALIHLREHLELRRIEFRLVKEMENLLQVVIQDQGDIVAMKNCTQQAEQILQDLREASSTHVDDNGFDTCSLAVQFVCVAFVSYVQAHVGPIKPFFLDTPQQELVLLGNQVPAEHSGVNVRPVKLTCLAGMVRDHVLAFSPAEKFNTAFEIADTPGYHVLATAEDLLDTWGPGYFIHDNLDSTKISAVAIGGGFIFSPENTALMFHWTTETNFRESHTTFQPSTKIMIGAIISVNSSCDTDGCASRSSSAFALENLGTHGPFWYTAQRQIGVQGGQYLNGTFLQTWAKNPGKTLKDYSLEQPERNVVYQLDQNWGLQVSFCTSVARRVPLRQLIADLLPEFVNPMDQDIWQELITVHNIIDVFTYQDIHSWLSRLSDSLRSHVIAMVYQMLWQLRHTGFDRQNSALKVAWPHDGDLRGLRIPCATHTCWAPILADAEDCATFAYVTTKCLETRLVRCQGIDRVWQNVSKMLVTEMSQHRLEGYSVTTTNANAPQNSISAAAARTTTSRWRLKDGERYYVKKFDTLIWVKVERTAGTDNDTPHLLMGKSKIPQWLWSRLMMKEEKKRNHCIREKQAAEDHAENVVVRSSP